MNLLHEERAQITTQPAVDATPLFTRPSSDSMRQHLPSLLFIACSILVIYSWGVWYPSLGPELALFYSVASGKTFSQVMSEYVNFSSVLWFRPTAFYLPYWIGERFLDWHNTTGWKLFQLAVLIPTCWAVYLFTQVLFRGQRLAGVIAALYLAVYPGCISVVLQSAAFDATHILFVVLTVVLFCWAQLYNGRKAIVLAALALLSFVAALTSKELTIVTPLYLACVSAVVLLAKRPETSIRRQVLMLLPFFALLPTYYYLRFLRMPSYERGGDYRTLFNADIVIENALKFPLWVLRLFVAPDSSGQSGGHTHALNLFIGLGVLAVVCAYWVPQVIRDRETRFKAALLVAWVAVFLSVPAYSGRYLWHVDLAVCGYALLVGVAASDLIGRISSPSFRHGVMVLVLAGIMAAGIVSSRDNVLRGVYSTAYRIGSGLLHAPPVPASQMPPDALVFIEDRLALTPWTYGGQALFRYIYLKPALVEKAVPALGKVNLQDRIAWLGSKHAYFFRYDDNFNWYDDSAAFRESSTRLVSQCREAPSKCN
jgi:hypothetical protein